MLRDIKRPINFRPLLFVALSLATGIILYRNSPTLKFWTFLIPIILTAIIIGVFYLVTAKEKRKTLFLTASVCLLFCFIGICGLAVNVQNTTKGFVASGDYLVEGEVSYVTYKNGVWHVSLTNCRYDGKNGGDLFAYNLKEEVKLYDILRMKCEVAIVEKHQEGKFSSHIINGNSMETVAVYGFDKIGVSDKLYAKFKTATDKIFIKAYGNNAGIASALIRGDVSQMRETVTLFRLVGIAHVFAVSGMHVGLLYTALAFIFKKLRVNRLIRTLLICFTLIFYSYLCGFTASSLRASIMCSVIAIGDKYLGEKYDGINSTAIAMVVVLLFKPNDLFSAGFILSFLICFAIIILSPPIGRVLKFLPQKLNSSLSVLISAQLVAIPLSIRFFGSFSLVSFFANLLLLPVVSALFYMTAIGLVACLLLPINEYVILFLPNIILSATKTVTEVISKFPMIINYFPKMLSVGYYSMLIISSDFINANKKIKFSCVVLCFVILLFVTTRSFFPFTT